MTNSHARLSPPSLVAAAAFVFICALPGVAQDAPRPASATPTTTTETAAPARVEATGAVAKETAPVAKDSAAAAQAKPADAAPERCACESPDDLDAIASPRDLDVIASPPEPVTAAGKQIFSSASARPKSVAPELFPRASLGGGQTTDATRQPTNAATWTPLTNGEKMKRAARNAFFSPIGVGRVLISSIITQYNEEDQPHKTTEDEFADGASRFAIRYSRRATRTLLGSGVYAALFNQDPRYDRTEEGKGFVARAGHAVSRVFVQRGDSGKLQPAVSRWAGSLSGSAISNLWERSTPGRDRIGTDATFRRFGNSFITDSINYLFVEFWPDIKKIFGR